MREDIEKVFAEIRPLLAQHLGDIEFVKFEEGVVYVKMLGTCVGCPLSQITLKSGVEEILKSRISEISRVEAMV